MHASMHAALSPLTISLQYSDDFSPLLFLFDYANHSHTFKIALAPRNVVAPGIHFPWKIAGRNGETPPEAIKTFRA